MLKQRKRFNVKIIIGAVIILAVGLILTGCFSGRKADDSNKAEKQKNKDAVADEAKENLNENQFAVVEAEKSSVIPVRAIDSADHVWGAFGAPVELIIYDDFACPFCVEFYETVKKIKSEFGDKVAIAFRHFPLTSHPDAVPAALASECADEQGKFWEMYDKIFEDNEQGKLNKDELANDAAELGLDKIQFAECLEKEKYKDKVQSQMLEGRNAGITGTPGNFLNGIPFPGAYPFEDFTNSQGQKEAGMKTLIEKELEKIK